MYTITANADVSVTASTISQSYENNAGQAGSVLTSRAIDDVKEADINSQKQDEQAISEKQLNREQLEEVAQQLQDFMGGMNRSLQFHVDEDSGRDVIKVVDKNTGDVIKQYPSEEVLGLVSKLSETAGKLIDHTV